MSTGDCLSVITREESGKFSVTVGLVTIAGIYASHRPSRLKVLAVNWADYPADVDVGGIMLAYINWVLPSPAQSAAKGMSSHVTVVNRCEFFYNKLGFQLNTSDISSIQKVEAFWGPIKASNLIIATLGSICEENFIKWL